MEFEDLSDDARYGIVLLAVGVATVAIGKALMMSSIPERLLLFVPAVFVFLGGLTWDRIYLHDRTI